MTQKQAIRIEQLRARGFDAMVGNCGALKITCAGCRPIVLGVTAVHELGCAKKKVGKK